MEEMSGPEIKLDCYFCDAMRLFEEIKEHEHGAGEVCEECLSGLAVDAFAGGAAAAHGRMPSPLPLCEMHRGYLVPKLTAIGLKVPGVPGIEDHSE
jgi:hypothetical protein